MKLQCTRRSIVRVTAQKEAELLQLGVPDPLDGAAQHPSAESLEAMTSPSGLSSLSFVATRFVIYVFLAGDVEQSF